MGWLISVITPPYLSSTTGSNVTPPLFASSPAIGFVEEEEEADMDLFLVAVEQLRNAEKPSAGKRKMGKTQTPISRWINQQSDNKTIAFRQTATHNFFFDLNNS